MTSLPKGASRGASAAELASLFGCTTRNVRELVARGIVVRVSHGRYNAALSTRNYIESLRSAASGRAVTDTGPNQRLKVARASLAELTLAKERGEVMPTGDATAVWQSFVLAVRQTILRHIPEQIAFDTPILSAHDRENIKQICRNSLWDMVLGRSFAVLGTDSGERCDGRGAAIPRFTDDEETRRAHEHLVYPGEDYTPNNQAKETTTND